MDNSGFGRPAIDQSHRSIVVLTYSASVMAESNIIAVLNLNRLE